MSFFNSLFNSELSREGRINHDLAYKFLENGDIESAEKYLIRAEIIDPNHQDIKVLRDVIEAEKINLDKERNELEENDYDSPWVILWFDEFDLDKIQAYTSNGYDIENIAVNNGIWYFILRHQQDGQPEQTYLKIETLNNNTFNEYFESYYSISSLGYDGAVWMFVFEERNDIENQAWSFSPGEFPKNELIDWENTNGRIEQLVDYDGDYFALSSFPNSLSEYGRERFESFPEERIKEVWEENLYIDCLSHINGHYFLMICKNRGLIDQGYYTEKEFPSKYLLEKMKEGYFIQHVQFADEVWQVVYSKKISKEEDILPEEALESEAENDISENDNIQSKDLNEEEVNEKELQDSLKELESLIGLKEIKNEIKLLIDYLKIGRLKKDSGLDSFTLNIHMIFSGSPGTGKTTVARLIGRILKALGLLTKGHVIETDRSGLVAEYVGKTAIKTQEKIEESMGGILFIDEAYALHKEGRNDFGHEALETILKQMEDKRSQFCVILAGYTDEMNDLIESNPGLKSRFSTHLKFSNFTGTQLMSILKKMLLKANHQLTSAAEEKCINYLQFLADTSDLYFGNAREVRNLFEDLLKNQSSRLAKIAIGKKETNTPLTIDELRTINHKDLQKSYAFQYKEKKEESLEDIMAQIDELVGLQNIKDDIIRLAQFLKVQKKRHKKGWEDEKPVLHSVFFGPPGTGKTTIARLLTKIYKSLNIISKENLLETSRSDLVAGYVGQTAIKTNKIIDKALHGVLFIDEAYALTSRGDNDFGHEAVETLLKRMEDERENIVVIVAGYENEMKNFIMSNPGLESRFNRKYYFKAFNHSELESIFLLMLKKSHYTLSNDAKKSLKDILKQISIDNNPNFGNARWVRNFFESCKMEQAQRICSESYIDEDLLQIITSKDLDLAFHYIKKESINRSNTREIGYK